jgi:hypothetical protein
MTERCGAIRTGDDPNKHAGEQRTWRCRAKATINVQVHQASDHPRVGTGWFVVPLCERCFREGKSQ